MLEVFALLNEILFMLNYGHPIKADADSHVQGWADANGIDLVSLLKMNNNYFFKKVKKSLKQSALFYEQRYLIACQ